VTVVEGESSSEFSIMMEFTSAQYGTSTFPIIAVIALAVILLKLRGVIIWGGVTLLIAIVWFFTFGILSDILIPPFVVSAIGGSVGTMVFVLWKVISKPSVRK
jgi:hypothetical protein